jgi:hypothetical protein
VHTFAHIVSTTIVHNTKVTDVHSHTMVGSLSRRSKTGSKPLKRTEQMLEIEMFTGENTAYGYSDRTHVHLPTRATLGSWVTRLHCIRTALILKQVMRIK